MTAPLVQRLMTQQGAAPPELLTRSSRHTDAIISAAGSHVLVVPASSPHQKTSWCLLPPSPFPPPAPSPPQTLCPPHKPARHSLSPSVYTSRPPTDTAAMGLGSLGRRSVETTENEPRDRGYGMLSCSVGVVQGRLNYCRYQYFKFQSSTSQCTASKINT